MIVAVLHGVNLNLLGRRDPQHYGTLSLQALETQIYAWARELGMDARCHQTNHEGEFVEHIQEAQEWASAVILNPGAWTHYAYSIRDAVDYLTIPAVEVHLSDIQQRERFRRFSVLEEVAEHRVVGKGPDGYRLALEWIRSTKENDAR